MSGIAKIYVDAELNPTKTELLDRYSSMTSPKGSYRLVDPEGEVGIEVHVGVDDDGRLIQMPMTYRAQEVNPAGTLSQMEHSILGNRYVTAAMFDPVAVREMIRTILQGDNGAEFSAGPGPILDVRGSGTEPEAEVSDVELVESTRQRASGMVRVDGNHRAFTLRMPNLLKQARVSAAGYTTTKLHLKGTTPEGEEVISAELFWNDLLK